MKNIIFFLCSIVISFSITKAQNKNYLDGITKSYITVNNISSCFWNNGVSDYDEKEIEIIELLEDDTLITHTLRRGAACTYPMGSNKQVVFSSGLLWGATIEDENYIGGKKVLVGGTHYGSNLQPGKIISPQNSENPSLKKNRIFRVRPDYKTANLLQDSLVENITINEIRKQYAEDWYNWPATDGAPFQDINKNGIYEPEIDIPGIENSAQTIWYVANDLDSSKLNIFGSEPLGVELQTTIWALDTIVYNIEAVKNTIFRKYILINKSTNHFKDMYFSLFVDLDIGNAKDDFVGCDSTLGLGFAYNGNLSDSIYSPLSPPAIGFDILQGPIAKGIYNEDKNKNGVDDGNEFAIFKNRKIGPGYYNQNMTSFYFSLYPIGQGRGDLGDILFLRLYNTFHGRISSTGSPFVSPITGKETKFMLSGNPLLKSGWVDGYLHPPSERFMYLSSGPFEMTHGDTQEVVIAQIVAGSFGNVDAITSVSLLKYYDKQIQTIYNYAKYDDITSLQKQIIMKDFNLSQNYPNPFNPTTIINYNIPLSRGARGVLKNNLPAFGVVTLKIYNILGKEITTLVNETKPSGTFEVNFDASNLPSGVYYYQLKTESFVQTKKMILLK
ncbi:MAG: T9SS type A sorting domain-containing protein [Melioribacteraceae bacterium]